MINRLKLEVDNVVTIQKDDAATLLLLQLGVLDKLPSKSDLPGTWAYQVNYDLHTTHWILAFRFGGFANAADNGFYIACYPKKHFSKADFDKQADAITNNFFDKVAFIHKVPITNISN